MFSVAGMDLLTIMEWQELVRWIGANVTEEPAETPMISGMFFGDDYEFTPEVLERLDSEVKFLEEHEDQPDSLVSLRERLNEYLK